MSTRAHSTAPVTVAHLYDAIEAGLSPVKAELAATRAELTEVRIDVSAIAVRLDAKPVRRWLNGRVTQLVDKALPLALVAFLTYWFAHFT